MIPFGDELLLIGRILYGVLFVYNGYNNLTNPKMVGYADRHGVPAPAILTRVAGVTILLGGLGIALGAFRTVAAASLVVFLLVASPMIHDYWNRPESERVGQFNHFMKNVALAGGGLAFLVMSDEAWAYALNVGPF